jgi:hypothetical protein
MKLAKYVANIHILYCSCCLYGSCSQTAPIPNILNKLELQFIGLFHRVHPFVIKMPSDKTLEIGTNRHTANQSCIMVIKCIDYQLFIPNASNMINQVSYSL